MSLAGLGFFLSAAFASFILFWVVDSRPSSYSALKKDGQRMSHLMSTGQKVEAKPARAVTVYNLTLQEFEPPLFTLGQFFFSVFLFWMLASWKRVM